MDHTGGLQTSAAASTFNDPRPASAASWGAVSWGAILAGAVAAAGVSLILLALGSGIGFAAISPWHDEGLGATAFTIAGAIWLIVTQWVSAVFAGYVAGRLRARWDGTHVHEVFFRDTAHGLVTWALATLIVAALAAAAAVAGISGGMRAASNVAAAGMQGAMSSNVLSYGVDKLFRPGNPTPSNNAAANGNAATAATEATDSRLEAGRIVVNALATGMLPDADRTYLANMVAARTGLSGAEA